MERAARAADQHSLRLTEFVSNLMGAVQSLRSVSQSGKRMGKEKTSLPVLYVLNPTYLVLF